MKHIVFDFDGTLVDSMGNYSKMIHRILDEHGVSYGDDVINIITPLGTEGTIKYLIGLGVNLSPAEVGKKMFEYSLEGYLKHIPAKSNVENTLIELKKRGFNLHVLTACHHDALDPCLKRLNLYNLFENVWSCDDFGLTKANPSIYIELTSRLHAQPSDILFLDDNINADTAAKKAGLNTCGVFDLSSAHVKDQMKQINDYYIDDFVELLDISF